jgi:phosphopantetheine--protein transferase-like protein
MVLGVGTDILLIDRMRRAPFEMNDAFIKRTYTEREREQALKRDEPAMYFATRFAGKEAVFKALGTHGGALKSLNEIEILSDESGRPCVMLHGDALAIAKDKGIADIRISLSYDTDYATAFAVAQSEGE